MELVEAVREARRVRGTVMLAVDGRDEKWCAVCGAVDGSVELRVGEPPRQGVLRRRAPGEQWLRDHGFLRVPDAWSRPESALGDEACAATLAAALQHALEADPSAPMHHVLTHPGVLDGVTPPPSDAPARDHIGAAMLALARQDRGRLDIDCGIPSQLWAIVWAADGALLVEQESPEREWTEPQTDEGAAAAAAALAEPSSPLYLAFMPYPADD